jgi:hypothetical protein
MKVGWKKFESIVSNLLKQKLAAREQEKIRLTHA